MSARRVGVGDSSVELVLLKVVGLVMKFGSASGVGLLCMADER